jgi:enoyl-CoA hydratase
MRYDTLALARRDHIAELRLARPGDGNPIDARFLAELEAASAELHDDADARVVLLTHEGGVFSAGARGEVPEHSSFRSLELLPQPVIAVIEGDAVGAGFELALACDVRIASESARFSLPQVANGGIPTFGGTQRLPRLAGRWVAAFMLLLGETLDGREAAACGLVNAALPLAEVRPHAERLAASMAARGPLALRYAKEAILRGLDMPLDQALRFETDLTVILQTTADRAEGVRAFLEKRAPDFEGR